MGRTIGQWLDIVLLSGKWIVLYSSRKICIKNLWLLPALVTRHLHITSQLFYYGHVLGNAYLRLVKIITTALSVFNFFLHLILLLHLNAVVCIYLQIWGSVKKQRKQHRQQKSQARCVAESCFRHNLNCWESVKGPSLKVLLLWWDNFWYVVVVADKIGRRSSEKHWSRLRNCLWKSKVIKLYRWPLCNNLSNAFAISKIIPILLTFLLNCNVIVPTTRTSWSTMSDCGRNWNCWDVI